MYNKFLSNIKIKLNNVRTSQYLFFTLKETPSDADIVSHKLMLRAGIISKVSSGIYTWLPTGLRILKKIENVIRLEMNKIGAIEISMPILQPNDLWNKSNRLKEYGSELLHVVDRNNRFFILSPTHEELITDLIKDKISSYKTLPINLFQIQTKFRDEIRPRFGVIRSREFIMKDAYSFHIDKKSLQKTYELMLHAYTKIFNTIKLKFRVVEAKTGNIGGYISHEFQAFTNNEKDTIEFSNQSNFSKNIKTIFSKKKRLFPMCTLKKIDVLGTIDIQEISKKISLPLKKIVKTFLVKAQKNSDYPFVILLLRADHKLNLKKIKKLHILFQPLTFATEKEIYNEIGTNAAFLGPIGLSFPIIADRIVSNMSDFSVGANINNKYFVGVNWIRDLNLPQVEDISHVEDKYFIANNKKYLSVRRSIEVGHIFQLGDKYSKSMKAFFQNKNGQNQLIQMGCYGMGVSRTLSAVIEQNYDERGIIWPEILAPFQLAILPINMHVNQKVKEISEYLYNYFHTKNLDVILDDRNEHFGRMYKDIELIGIPHIIIISQINIENDLVEYKTRDNQKKEKIKINQIFEFIEKKLK